MSQEQDHIAKNIGELIFANGAPASVRRTPPNRRASETITFKWPPNSMRVPTYFVSSSKSDAGVVYEIFVASARPSSPMADVIRDASIIISLALQYGVNINTLRHSITRLNDNTAASIIGAALDLISPPDDGADVVSDPMLTRPRILDATTYVKPSARKAMVEAL
jgi:hypothetical protein